MAVSLLGGISSPFMTGNDQDEKDTLENKVSLFFLHEREKFESRLVTEEIFLPFRWMAQSLKDFLIMEKLRLCRNNESRVAVDAEGNPLTGYSHCYDIKEDCYDPSCMEPFPIKGYWIPEKDGELFINDEKSEYSFLKKTALGVHCLFLVHPKSEDLFAPLIARYKDTEQIFAALSLSSVRSLLVALPADHATFSYQMVKVSLKEKLGGTLRVLSRKECGSSVRVAALFSHRTSPISIISEDVAFIPQRSMLSEKCEASITNGAGTIFRSMPVQLVSYEKGCYVVPLYALLGSNNIPFLTALICQSGLSPEDFIEQKILRPLSQKIVELVFLQRTSLEIHGQNLLLHIKTSPKDVSIDFLYRDLGGVNLMIQPRELEHIPSTLRSDDFSWELNFVKDAADVLEAFSFKVLFSFTKLFFNTEGFSSLSPRFLHWKKEMIARGLDINWRAVDGEDQHQEKVPIDVFCRYGYFEKQFGFFLLDHLENIGFFAEEKRRGLSISKQDFSLILQDPQMPFSNCLQIEWFYHLVTSWQDYFS